MSESTSHPVLSPLPLPFLNISGVVNIRPFSGSPQDQPRVSIKPRQVFRSAELSKIDENGKLALRELGVTTVFDLRSPTEIAQFKSTTPDIPGVRVILTPALKDDFKLDDLATIWVGLPSVSSFAIYETIQQNHVLSIVQLLGFSDEDIARDYGLTTIGLAPYVAALEPRFRAVPAFRDNWEGFLNMSSSRSGIADPKRWLLCFQWSERNMGE
ncbi:hypothetical protein H0H92_001282 [Tricholoma furcatifolium]|nr:hypothetical protein H0H92_001282 [Tricholoma furcatifolium]